MRARSPRRSRWARIVRPIACRPPGGTPVRNSPYASLGAHAHAVFAIAKAFVRRDGLRVPSSESHLVAKRVAALPQCRRSWTPSSRRSRGVGTAQCPDRRGGSADRGLAARGPDCRPAGDGAEVGPLTASAVVSTIDDVTRFPSAHQFEAFLGLVPGERSSGNSDASATSPRPAIRERATSWSRRGGPAPRQVARDRGAARVGPQDRRPSRQPHRGRRAGASSRRDPVRDVARQHPLQRREAARAVAAHDTRRLVARATHRGGSR